MDFSSENKANSGARATEHLSVQSAFLYGREPGAESQQFAVLYHGPPPKVQQSDVSLRSRLGSPLCQRQQLQRRQNLVLVSILLRKVSLLFGRDREAA